MKKQYILFFMLAIGINTARAQSSATTISYNNNMQPALVLELSENADAAEAVILQKLKETGYDPETRGHLFWKKNKIDGFYMFNNVSLFSVSTLKLDMYFKIVQKNNEEKNNSTVYMLISKGNENFVSAENDPTLWDSCSIFLNSFVDKTTAYSLEQDILKQEAAIADAQKKLSILQKEEQDLSDKIKKYQEDLLNNQNNQKKQQADIENQSRLLEDLKSKRK